MKGLRFSAIATIRCVTLSLTLLLSGQSVASERNNSSDWDYRLTPYLWGANISANALGRELDVPFSTLLDDLSMGFMGDFQVRRDKWPFGLDVLYMDESVSKNESITLPGEGPVNIGGSAELKAWVVTPAVGYALVDSDTKRFEVFGGLRYLDIQAEAKLTAQDEVFLDGKTDTSYWDAIGGALGYFDLSDKWYISVYGDIGFGDSKDTWQLMAGVAYRFKKVDARLVYRYMKYSFDSDDLLDDLVLKGPALGFSFYF